jgi:hypothetical protein
MRNRIRDVSGRGWPRIAASGSRVVAVAAGRPRIVVERDPRDATIRHCDRCQAARQTATSDAIKCRLNVIHRAGLSD